MLCNRPIIVALLMLLIPLPTQARDLSSLFEGTWVGTGWVRPSIFGKKRKTRCRVRGQERARGEAGFSGRCATANRTVKFAFSIKFHDRRKSVTARTRFGKRNEAYDFSGRHHAKGIDLAIDRPFAQNGRTLNSNISIIYLKNDRFAITEIIRDQDTGEVSKAIALTFSH